MPSALRRVDIFAEDQAHETFIRALIKRVAAEEGVGVHVAVRSAQGGHSRAIAEFRLYQRTAKAASLRPDLLIIVIDGNCQGWNTKRSEVQREVDGAYFGDVIVACPEPHIERWFLADPEMLSRIFRVSIRHEPRKCERNRYKTLLETGFRRAGHPLMLGGIELADEIVEHIDLYKAGKREPSLENCIAHMRRALRGLRPA